MKIHTPMFVIGLLVFITPFLGFPSSIEAFITGAFGIAIMIISSTISCKKEAKNEQNEEQDEKKNENQNLEMQEEEDNLDGDDIIIRQKSETMAVDEKDEEKEDEKREEDEENEEEKNEKFSENDDEENEVTNDEEIKNEEE